MGAVSWLLAAGMAALISLAGVASGVWPHSAAASGGVTAPAKARSVSTDVLGARVQAPPAAWPVRGCEVMTVQPGSTVASLGLVGASQRIDPMGDVIAAVQDVTVGGGTQATPDCAALAAAAARAHDGDTITVTYDHRIAGHRRQVGGGNGLRHRVPWGRTRVSIAPGGHDHVLAQRQPDPDPDRDPRAAGLRRIFGGGRHGRG